MTTAHPQLQPASLPVQPTTPAEPFKVQASGSKPMPPGVYLAIFEGCEPYTLEGVPKWRWKFKVSTGAHAGSYPNCLTDQAIKATNHAGRIVAGLLEKALVEGENLQAGITACTGKIYLVSVQAGPKGGKPSVQSVGPPPPM